jgi:hypothetical protein
VYNTILRKFPENEYKIFDSKGNLFPATIFVLVSAVQKLARVTKVPPNLKLYRGLGGTSQLPDSFFVPDEYGCTGFTEWCFISATSSLSVAADYSGVKENKPLPMVLEIRVGSVDRAASVKDYSQYPQEKEYLFVPCSFLQEDGPHYVHMTQDGVVFVIPVMVNVNLKTFTVDDFIEQQRDIHISAFRYLIGEIEQYLSDPKIEERMKNRLQDDNTGDEHSLESFVTRTLQQCNNVYARHQAEPAINYMNNNIFRRLVLEMVEVRMMATSKVEEWLQNTTSSFIKYRIGAELRTVHRRHIAFLNRQLDQEPSESQQQKLALELCVAKGLVSETIEEKNDLEESPLMVAAAEGRSRGDLMLLITAKANVFASRPDGVCAMWLAAQFGNVECIDLLHLKKASVDQASMDGTTPVSIAAQVGNLQCVTKLIELGADFRRKNNKNATPLDQATLNRHADVMALLSRRIEERGAEPKSISDGVCTPGIPDGQHTGHDLIISTGDIADVDGLFALAEYGKTGADVLFIMNYPAYLGLDACDEDYEDLNPGRGYRYTLKEVLANDTDPSAWPEGYVTIMREYGGLSKAEDMRAALTDMAFEIVSRIWEERRHKTGRLYFCIGGVNSVNPFAAGAIKNELLVYSKLVPRPRVRLVAKQGLVYDAFKCFNDRSAESHVLDLKKYSNIYIDFIGPMSFFDDEWSERLREARHQVKGAFIMGGVLSSEPPATSPSLPGVLNRFSSASMNQLYHPQCTASFFSFLELNKIPSYVIVNNVVCDLSTLEPDTLSKTFHGVDQFLSSNDLTGDFLGLVTKAHYLSKYKQPRKPYDFYTALALTGFLRSQGSLPVEPRRLFYSGVYGLALVSESDSWDEARREYASRVDTSAREVEAAFERCKKESFRRELAMMAKLDRLDSFVVQCVQFDGEEASRGFKIALKTGVKDSLQDTVEVKL